MAKSFSAGLAGYAKRAKVSIDTAVTEVCAQTSINIIKRSPVDTGRFRGAWLAEINTIPSSEASETRRESEAISDAVSTAGKASGHIFYLTNNVSYGYKLEYGWSKQAPQGMVRLSVAQTINALKGFK